MSAKGIGALVRYVSLRSVVSSPLRSLLTLFGVALGVAMVVGMTSVNDAVLASFREMVDRAGGKADLEIVGDDSGVPQEIVETLVDQQGVAHVDGVLEKTTLLSREGTALGTGERVLVLGVDVLGDLALVPFQKEGAGENALVDDPLAFLNDPSAILLTDTLAARLGVKKGELVRMRTANLGDGPASFHVEGIVHETRAAKAFGGLVAIMSLDAAQLAFGAVGRVDRIDVALAPGVDRSRIQHDLQTIVAGRGDVQPPARRGEQTAKMVQSLQVGLQLSAAIAMLVGMFLIYNTISVAVAQRRRDFGILRAVGLTRARLTTTVLAEALVLALVGGAAGVGLGLLLARALVRQVAPQVSRFYQPIVPPPPVVSLRLALVAMAIGIAATLFAAWVPARRAAKMSPVETLRRDLIATQIDAVPHVGLALGGVAFAAILPLVLPRLLRRFPPILPGYVELAAVAIAGACCVPLAIVVLHRLFARLAQRSFGVSARLGVDNVMRAIGRSSTTAAALAVATCATIATAGLARSFRITTLEWLDQSVPGDVFVSAGSPLVDRNAIPFSADVVKKLEDPPIPGVAAIDTVRAVRVSLLGRRIPILSNDTAFYFTTIKRFSGFRRVVEGDPDLKEHDLDQSPTILVSENFARALDLHPGQSIDVPTPSGAVAFVIRAVVVDYSDEQGWGMIDKKFYRQYWRDDRIDMLKVFVSTPGGAPASLEDSERVADEVRKRLGTTDDGLFVVTASVWKDEVRRAIADALAVADASQLVAFVVAVLGVIGTMLAAVIDRTREIGVLRAIGATRGQIVRAVCAEAAFLGFVSAVVGVLAGVPAAFVFTRVVGFAATGWNVPFSFPAMDALRVALAILIVSALAGVLPGRRAAKMKVPHALAYE